MTNADMPSEPCTVGLTKREEFAARNMAAILGANPLLDVEDELMDVYTEAAAGYAVMSADVLLSVLGKGGDVTSMREAQQSWDNAQPPDTSRREREHEQACKKALAHYLKTGDLPGGEDASHVWDELGDDDESGVVLFDMFAAYQANNGPLLLALAKTVAARVESIVNEKIEEGV